ncbi:class I SAM-dependent methyltransferase [Thalassotalea sp. M1531]|uniref:Class I SAM-dependent methyltransferase n=1 Tax=Thalassotalea algicola TaxID=2716224 RepID=A0A7Y0LEP1_9GAMM|nr:methyltransferase domain-containing protein [Thalassotalea algicola]NMP33133.1 class I SAM-dependent methyltransferase [Thalassotalea algicola]
MGKYNFVAGLALLFVITNAKSVFAESVDKDAVWHAVHNNSFRTAEEIKRDKYRNPEQVLRFFEINEASSVGEVAPGGGWYTHILAPLLKEKGRYVGLQHNPAYYGKWPEWAKKLSAYPEKIKNEQELYGNNAIGTWLPAVEGLPVEAASLDFVFITRTMHNWQNQGRLENGLKQSWQILKNNGVLAIVQHREDESSNSDREASSKRGRWKQSDLISVIESFGFKLVASSEMNSNLKDTKNYEKGVWTLPPSLALKEKDKDVYTEIGESDRMTLKFIKVSS